MPNENTPRGYPLPHRNNALDTDVERLREAFGKIDADIGNIFASLEAQAAAIESDHTGAQTSEGGSIFDGGEIGAQTSEGGSIFDGGEI